jgi:riboflavin biosynthesis pyrimidine reductase
MDVPVTPGFLAEAGFRPLFLTRRASIPPGFPAEIAGYDGDDLPVAWILGQLRARGVQRLLVEAGGDLLFQFLAADAIDEMHVTLVPLVIGGDAPTLADGAGFDFAGLRRLSLLACEVAGDEVFLHYAVRRGS